MCKDLLIEIGTEELPPGSLQEMSCAFSKAVIRQFSKYGIGHGVIRVFATPRRLAVLLGDVHQQAAEREIVRRGPSVAASFTPDGLPTKAALGFARSCGGVELQALSREVSDTGQWLVFRSVIPGRATSELLPEILEIALSEIPVSRRMRWGQGNTEFVRPIHWICVVFGGDAVTGTVWDVEFGNETFGHRFHAPEALVISSASAYEDTLRNTGYVEPCFATRKSWIVQQIQQLANDCGLSPNISPALLEEVTGLVEWPQAILASFDPGFLAIPPEVLVETMQKNQKYFPLRSDSGALDSRFVVIANIASRDIQQVRKGNERVIRPRFSDARFFWEQDLTTPLVDRFKQLEAVVFQEQLGSVGEKVIRVGGLACEIAVILGVSVRLVERAAYLSKCDLVTMMVAEFPTLQGTMGRYYAEHAGESVEVCVALEEQYLPRFSGDSLPISDCGRVLALAERLDTLVGAFGVGCRPSGAKDPYGMRRASIATLRILMETPLELDLRWLLQLAARGFEPSLIPAGTIDSVLNYMLDRLTGYFQEQGIAQDTVDAVVATNDAVVSRLHRKVLAVHAFRALPGGAALIASNKRIANILGRPEAHNIGCTPPVASLFLDDAEMGLSQAVCAIEADLALMLRSADFLGILVRLGDLRQNIDVFFERVLVMADDVAIRENRLRLLFRVHSLFRNVADLSLLR